MFTNKLKHIFDTKRNQTEYSQGSKICEGPKKIYAHRSAAIFCDCPPFDYVALAFMWLAPSFEKISHYILYIIFRFNFKVVSLDNLY
jgi:hypothetical protein